MAMHAGSFATFPHGAISEKVAQPIYQTELY